jgi:16S rRNA (uracil1498-N3)-methyltransferase
MRLHRFYIDQKVGDQKEITLSDSELIHQIMNVFRLRAGNQVIVFDGSGFEYVSDIVLITKKELVLKVIEVRGQGEALSQKPKVSLYLALIKKGNFELAVEKCTEIGVDEIHPVISERSEKKDLNIERLNKIVKEAGEQSERLKLPLIYPLVDLKTAVSQVISQNEVGVTFHTDSTTSASEGHSSLEKEEKGNVAVFVGCEGGWTEKEMELFKKNNFEIRSLGPNILRAETAAIVAVWEVIK